nr:hypothetical protein [Mucilaginibacter sp. L294]
MNKKTKFLAVALTALALFIGVQSNAQSVKKGKLRFNIGTDALLPVGDFSKTSNFGLGITPQLQYGLTNRVALTFTSGIYHFFPKDMISTDGPQPYKYRWDMDLIPAKAGIKAFVTSNIYVNAEAGIGFQVDNGGGDSKFMASGGAGYATKRWDFGVRYENFSGNNYRNGMIGLRVAYGFGL